MITHINKDITDVSTGIVVHGCNAQGVMGSGVAKQLRAKYQWIYTDYLDGLVNLRRAKKSPLGAVVWSTGSKFFIANCITQEFYGRDGKQYVSYNAVETALKNVRVKAGDEKLDVYCPYLIGAGLGGGDPNRILAIIDDVFANSPINFYLCHHAG